MSNPTTPAEHPEGQAGLVADPQPAGLTMDQLNGALCTALGVDPDDHVGFRLTVLGGEMPALEAFHLPPQTPDGMFDGQTPLTLEQLVSDGARVVPAHLAMTEFTLAKLLEAERLVREALSTEWVTRENAPGDPSVVETPRVMAALAALEAGLSGWAEAGAPKPAVYKGVALVDIDGKGLGLVEGEHDEMPLGQLLEVYAIPVNPPQPLAEQETAAPTGRPATYDGTVDDAG